MGITKSVGHGSDRYSGDRGKMMVLADELDEELSSREDDSSGWKEAPGSSKGVKVITTGFCLFTSLIVSLSLIDSVDSRVKNWPSNSLSMYITVKLSWS